MSPEKFETTITQLEKIVDELESGELDLDTMLKKYEQGIKLSQTCNKLLRTAEKKIELLRESAEGFTTEPFDEEGQDREGNPKKKRKKK